MNELEPLIADEGEKMTLIKEQFYHIAFTRQNVTDIIIPSFIRSIRSFAFEN